MLSNFARASLAKQRYRFSEIFRSSHVQKIFPFLLLLIFSSFNSIQKIPIKGVVLNESGLPLAGCTVTIKGNTLGVSTDKNGAFTIDVPDKSAVLVFSFIGYESKEMVPVLNKQLVIKLIPQNTSMSEVVVVGYGTQKKTSVTAAVSVIKGESIAAQPVANISNSIGGRVAGVIFTQGSGEPGYDGSRILIRGMGTNGNANPLVIVDGIPRNFTQLDPNSIASLSILKDAAAVAPYGMGGANGVILITTKKGRAGPPSLTYSGFAGWQNPTKLAKFVDAYQYATLFNEANDLEGSPHAYSDYALQKYRDGTEPDLYPNHDVLDELTKKNTLITSHNLTMTGGVEKIKYFASLGYLSQDGLWGPTKYKRYSLTTNVDADVTNTTKVNLSLNGRVEDRKYPGVSAGNIFYQAFRTPANAPLTFSNGLPGSYIGRSAAGNIFGSGEASSIGYTLLNSFSIEQQLPFIKGLSVKGLVSYDFNPINPEDPTNPAAPIITFSRTWLTPIKFYRYDSATNTYPQAGNDGPAKPQYTELYTQVQAFTYQFYANYNRSFGKHDITGLIVLESRNLKSSVFGAGRVNYNVSVPELNNGSSNSTDINNSGYSSQARQKSAVYRVTYGYNNRYLLEASGRYDGNYYFAPGKRFGFFPAFSAGWRISEEPFIRDNIKWINNLKIRGSYGESGALAGSPFQYLSSFTLYGNASVINGSTTQGLYENAQSNPDITWERAKKTDIGIEATLFNGLLNLEADIFFEKRSDILFPPTVTLPQEYGIGLSQVNAGAMSNRGFELTVGSNHAFSKDLVVGLTANITFARNKLREVFETEATFNNPNRRVTGRPLNTRFGYQALGYFADADFNADGTLKDGIASQPFSTTLHPGDIRYADVYGLDGKSDGTINTDDNVPIGQPYEPEIIYGFSPSINFKAFDLSLLFQGATRRDFYQSVFAFDNSSSATIDALDHWTPENTNAQYPRITTQPTTNNTQTSSWWIRDGSYLRLKTGEIGYTIPAKVMSRIRIQTARFYISGQNVLTFTKIENFDPEVSVNNGQYYPQQKVVSVGLNITF